MKRSINSVVYVLAAILFLINIILIMKNTTSNFFTNIGILPLPYLIFGILMFILLSGLKQHVKKLKNLNNWFILAITLVTLLSIFTFHLYNNYTSYQLPLSFTQAIGDMNKNQDILTSVKTLLYITFESNGNEKDFVLGTVVYSLMNLTYNENFTHHLSKIEKTYFYKNNSQKTEVSTMDQGQVRQEHNFTQHWNLDFKIDEEFDHALVNLYFSNDSENFILTNRYWVNPKSILSKEVYLSKTKDSLSLFLTAISILLFSTVAVIKNLMDIYYHTQSKNK